jgi:Protein of unknown function (DUF2510)
MTTQQAPAAGWYPDPEHAGTQRFWSGTDWTDNRAPLEQKTTARKAGVGSYIAAVLLPIVGVIIAIVQFARGNTGSGMAVLLTSLVAGFIWASVLVGMAASDYEACINGADTLREMSRC